MSDDAIPVRRNNVALIISLCLNIVLIALIMAAVWRATHPRMGGAGTGLLSPSALMNAVPAERKPIKDVLDSHIDKLRLLRAASVAARMHAFDVLSSDNYGADRLAKAFDDVRNADSALEAELSATMEQSIAKLTPEERKTIGESVQRRNNSWFMRAFRRRNVF